MSEPTASLDSLNDWLEWQSGLHPTAIDLGLERSREVAQRLGIDHPTPKIISIAGTNGKGSCLTYLESMLRAAGMKVGGYLSPHLLRYNERIRIEGGEVLDDALISAFEQVDAARSSTTLTFFEFGTLAAMLLFSKAELDVVLLEVGLGGRLDVVNVFDADVSVLTSIDIDHVEWLGSNREQIGFEKAGILRSGKPCVVGDRCPPRSVLAHAESLNVPVHLLGRDYHIDVADQHWSWWCGHTRLERLPAPALEGAHQFDNAATAIMALECLGGRLDEPGVRRGLRAARLPGRIQILNHRPEIIVDVAHNPDAVGALARALSERPCRGRTLALLAMYADKNIEGAIEALMGIVDEWHVSGLGGPRGLSAAQTHEKFPGFSGEITVHTHDSVAKAFCRARDALTDDDRLVVFGSFQTVREVLQLVTELERG